MSGVSICWNKVRCTIELQFFSSAEIKKSRSILRYETEIYVWWFYNCQNEVIISNAGKDPSLSI
jgi:hypothetical protein